MNVYHEGVKKTRKIILIFLILFFCVGCVTAWQIHSDRYGGTVEFFVNGIGVARTDGYYSPIIFSWIQTGDVRFEARYIFYRCEFVYDPVNDIITSIGFPGAYLTRV